MSPLHTTPKRFGRIADTIFTTRRVRSQHGIRSIPNTVRITTRATIRRTPPDVTMDGATLNAPRHGEERPLLYPWKGKMPSASRTWAVKQSTMEEYETQGVLRYTKTGTPTLLQFADEMPGFRCKMFGPIFPLVNSAGVRAFRVSDAKATCIARTDHCRIFK